MGEFDPIVRVPRGLEDRIGDEFPPGDGVTAQPVRHDLAWLTLSQQSLDEALCSVRISSLLEQHVDDFAVPVDGPPQVPLLTSDPDEDLVQVESVAVAAVPAPQSMRVSGPELVAPEANRLVGDQDASPGQDVFDVPMANVEAVVEPDGVLDDLWGESVPLVRGCSVFHLATVAQSRSGELNASRDNMRWMSDRYRDDMAALRKILAALDSEAAPALAQADLSRGLLALFYPRILYIQYDLINELQHSDGLRSIPQDDLHGALRELTARYHELETIQAMRQPLAMGSQLTDFPFVRATVEQNLESRASGTLIVTDIDWVEAKTSSAFHNAVAQSHSYIRSLLTSLEVAKVMATETARLMKIYGYSPETTWYETIGEPLEQQVSNDLIKLLTEGSD